MQNAPQERDRRCQTKQQAHANSSDVLWGGDGPVTHTPKESRILTLGCPRLGLCASDMNINEHAVYTLIVAAIGAVWLGTIKIMICLGPITLHCLLSWCRPEKTR